MKLLEQFPKDEGDVFNMDWGTEEPRNDYMYTNHVEPSYSDTVTVSLEKVKYPDMVMARKRAAEVFVLRGLRPYKQFQTARCWSWYCVPQ